MLKVLKVLIIEDDKNLQSIYFQYLKEKGFKPEIFSLGKNFDLQLEKNEVVIADWNLEEMGITNARFLIERALGKGKKVIVVSGEIDQIPKKIKEKVFCVLEKPISWPKLENILLRINTLLLKQKLQELEELKKQKQELEELFEPL